MGGWKGRHQDEIIYLKSSSLQFHCLGSLPNGRGGGYYPLAWYLSLSLPMPMRSLCWVKFLTYFKPNIFCLFICLFHLNLGDTVAAQKSDYTFQGPRHIPVSETFERVEPFF